jgi:hypothetical protein
LQILADQYPTAVIAQGKLKLPALSNEATAAITRRLVTEGIDVYGITRGDNDLETIFMNITNN